MLPHMDALFNNHRLFSTNVFKNDCLVCRIGVVKVLGQLQVSSIGQMGYCALGTQTILNRLIVKCVHKRVELLLQLLIDGFHVAFAVQFVHKLSVLYGRFEKVSCRFEYDRIVFQTIPNRLNKIVIESIGLVLELCCT